jgi:hypothetical protein
MAKFKPEESVYFHHDDGATYGNIKEVRTDHRGRFTYDIVCIRGNIYYNISENDIQKI